MQVASKGAQTAIILPQWKPKEIILAGRTKSKIQPVIDLIRKDDPDVAIGFIKLDLADQSSILQAVKEISGRINKPDVLINNAGGGLLGKDDELQGTLLLIESRCNSHGPQKLHHHHRWN